MKKSPSGRYITNTVAGESVRAFVPNPLPPRLPARLIAELEKPLRRAESALAKLELVGEMIPSLNWFIYAFVRKEALLSSEIEGTQTTLVDVLTYENTEQLAASAFEDIEEVANYVAAINHAFSQLGSARGLPVSARLLNNCHGILMVGARGAHKQPGAIRRSQTWIGGTRPGNAVFVPPPPEHIDDLIADLETYIHNPDDLPALLRVAIAHVQFETIHPYLDGNGRLGRMLIAMLLTQWGLLSSPLLYLSVYLKAHQKQYYDCLSAVRLSSDWGRWFAFFLTGIEEVANDAISTAQALYRRISADRTTLLAASGTTVTALQLVEHLPEHPVVSMPAVTTLLQTTKPTAGKAIEHLVLVGILREIGKRKRDRIFAYQRYLDELA
jgi:Fic family protein